MERVKRTPKAPKLYNLVEYYDKKAVSTLHWNLPYAIIKFKKRIAEIDKKYPKGTYFVSEPVVDPSKRKLNQS